MSKIYTIVAVDRRDQRGMDNITADTEDTQVDTVLTKLVNRTNITDHKVQRAWSILQLKKRLQPPPGGFVPDIVQIVGHGDPGRLMLAIRSQDEFDQKGYYVISSDESSFRPLEDVNPPPSRLVLLLGCSVGGAASGYHHDGPTLLFGLARLWGCRVGAPVDAIEGDDFDDEGIFKAVSPSLTAADQASFMRRLTIVSASANGNMDVVFGTPKPPLFAPTTTKSVRLERLLSTSLVGLNRALRQPSGLEFNFPGPGLPATLNQSIGEEIVTHPILAAPEAVFACKLIDTTLGTSDNVVSSPGGCFAELIVNGTMLRISVCQEPGVVSQIVVLAVTDTRAFRAALRRLDSYPLPLDL